MTGSDFGYVLPRLMRHFMPDNLVRFLLHRQWIIRPGLETRAPQLAVERYLLALAEADFSLQGRRVLVFGYGGRFEVGCRLLQAGAGHVILADRFARPEERANRALLPVFPDYLQVEGRRAVPRAEFISLLHADIRQPGLVAGPVDLVLSSSVFEHLDDVPGILAALAELTRPGGVHVHFVDLRDHFFKYPFHMLMFSQSTWQNWLNPTSNLNRYRLADYRRVFAAAFAEVELRILETDLVHFNALRSRIRPEFLSGDDEADSVTQIRVLARRIQREQTGPPGETWVDPGREMRSHP